MKKQIHVLCIPDYGDVMLRILPKKTLIEATLVVPGPYPKGEMANVVRKWLHDTFTELAVESQDAQDVILMIEKEQKQ